MQYHFRTFLLAFCLAIASSLAPAQAGVAITQAVEQGGGICAKDNAADAFECAKAQCMESGAMKDDCLEMSWCLDGQTVDVFMQSNEGNHWHEYYCGWKDRKTAINAGKLACNADRKKDLMECAPVQIIDDKGVATEVTEDELK